MRSHCVWSELDGGPRGQTYDSENPAEILQKLFAFECNLVAGGLYATRS